MEKKKVVPVWVSVINLILAVCGLAWTGYSMMTVTPPNGHALESQINQGLIMACLIVAAIYCLAGYKKSAAVFFKVVVSLYAAITFVAVLLVHEGPLFLTVISTLAFGILCVFAVAKDLGKTKSYVLCWLNIVLAALRVVLYVIVEGQLPGGLFSNLLLAVILGIMMYAKYADKAARAAE